MMSLIAKLLLGFLGSGLACGLALYMPLPVKWADWLDAHRWGDDVLIVGLLTLNVSGWIVAVVV